MIQHYNIRYAPSLNVLFLAAQAAAAEPAHTGWIGFGDPVYGDDDPRLSAAQKVEAHQNARTGSMIEKYLSSENRGGADIPRIPATGDEIKAVAALEKAGADAKVRETAGYYLGEAYALAGNIDQSIKVTAGFISSSSMPQQYRDRATVRQAANQYQKGRQFDAIGTWDDLSKKQPEDPDLLAEILLSCGRLRIDCPTVAQRSAVAVEAGEGKRYAGLNIALGRYYQGKKNYTKAVPLLEAGRDKGNKNKIASNDPVMLVSLADAYYRTKKFSEALEIYFEMSKQFPQVRQLQEALQGIYAMEHKSAGDVKIN